MAVTSKVAEHDIVEAPYVRRYEQIVVDVDGIMMAEAGHLGLEEIHSWPWRLMGEANVSRIEQGKDHIFVALVAIGGSAHKLQLHSVKNMGGKDYRFYLHYDVELPGVMVREIDGGEKVLTIIPEVCDGDTLAVGVMSALTGEPCMEAVSFSALERVRVSQVINKIRDELMRTGFSQFTKIKLLITGGQTPLSSNTIVWDPRWTSPIGAVGPIRRRISNKMAGQTLETYFKSRRN